jgi:hypothetical protein
MSLRTPSAVIVAAALATMSVSTVCSAQSAQASPTPQASPAAQAETCIERGVAARARGEDDAALAEFQRAFALTPTARVQGQIALAEQALGRWADAERDLLAALDVRSDPWIARNEPALRQALTQIQTRLSSLDVRVGERGAEIFINERLAGTAPLARPLRVAWGTVTIEVRARGFVTQRRTMELAAGTSAREEFSLVRESSGASSAPSANGNNNAGPTQSAAAPSATGARAPDPVPPQTPGIAWGGPAIVGVTGLATLGTSVVFAVLRQGAYDACPYSLARMGLECTTSESYSRATMGPTWTTATNVTLVLGGALVAGAGVWLTINALSSRRREAVSARSAPWVAPMFASGQPIGLVLGGAL